MDKSMKEIPLLNRQLVEKLQLKRYSYPDDAPTKILQFGTGMLLRGLVGDMVEKSNEDGSFSGKIVVVKSTGPDVSDFERQDNVYTLLIRGIEDGRKVNDLSLNSSIKAVYAAEKDWDNILQAAADPALQTIISNTTEAGLAYEDEWIEDHKPPRSFPGKLFACLLHRYKVFKGWDDSGVVVLPLELVHKNGEVLKEYIIKHARRNNAGEGFLEWLHTNDFCNTIVDRIVPGRTEEDDIIEVENATYKDLLHVTAEPYNLLAVEGGKKVKEKIGFGKNIPGFIVAESIEDLKEQKLRILNGSNTLVACPAIIAGLVTTYDTMQDQTFSKYTESLIHEEILPTIKSICPNAVRFSTQVLDRFRNPFIRYPLTNICFQATSKMNSRVTATINWQYRQFGEPGALTLIGLASWFIYYTPKGKDAGKYYCEFNGKRYYYRDDNAAYVLEILATKGYEEGVPGILQNTKLFQVEPEFISDLERRTVSMISTILKNGVTKTIQESLKK